MKRHQASLAFVLPLIPPALVVGVRFLGTAPDAASANGVSHYEGEEFQEFDRIAGVAISDTHGRDAWNASTAALSKPWRGTPVLVPVRDENNPDPIPEPDGGVSLPALVLTTIFGDGAGGGGVLSGRIYRIGDRIEGGWVLESVDRTRRTVTLRHSSGASGTVPLSRGDED